MFKWLKKIFNRKKKDPQTVKGVTALVVGRNILDPYHYNGWAGQLPDCVQDAKRFVKFLKSRGVTDIVVLINEQATKENFEKYCIEQGKKAEYGLIVYQSGHGGQIPDDNGDETEDGLDEVSCLYNGMWRDDNNNRLLERMPAHKFVISINDACTGASLMRSMPTFKCKVLHWAGCADGKVSMSTGHGGAFTNAVLDKADPDMTWLEWRNAVSKKMGKSQEPVMLMYNYDWNDKIALPEKGEEYAP